MATLTMQPIDPAPAAHEGSGGNKVAEDGGDLGDIDSGWVFLGKSDIVPADLAAAAAAHGGLRSSSAIPTWARWVLGGVVYTVVPFYKRVRTYEDETVGYVETAVEVVEHAAEATEKLAANVADQLPENGSLQKALEKVEYIADVVDKDAEKFEAIVEKIDKYSDKIDAEVEPVIEELEKELNQL
ncbi:uncharacterized protein LOC100843080 isoform X2 [Brachypodium distachyon]|uniref:Uncharacterized protein n=1 Tax=Brachypodium distachyon TaxID=15368 RepID=I1I7Y7_BRADI|nr:uncharacterized protein LOC100843080 isoform X2 [Brachypodium distachyon]KQJ98701.1 hypothetical protein BRADI_3g38517v3 [Brachypodium distachyon]|eukprot:XP_010235230.1 uncharacterized protein LOC100843080 isoform X2 [Brachypodium distachyon]